MRCQIFFIWWKVKHRKTPIFLIRWHLQKFDSGDFFEHVVFCYLGDGWKMDEFWRKSMDFIWRSRRALLRCFQKSFHNLKVKNPKQPLAKIFQFFNFVPHRSNYNPPNFCALKMIFDRERAKTLKNSLFKILRQSPTVVDKKKLPKWGKIAFSFKKFEPIRFSDLSFSKC